MIIKHKHTHINKTYSSALSKPREEKSVNNFREHFRLEESGAHLKHMTSRSPRLGIPTYLFPRASLQKGSGPLGWDADEWGAASLKAHWCAIQASFISLPSDVEMDSFVYLLSPLNRAILSFVRYICILCLLCKIPSVKDRFSEHTFVSNLHSINASEYTDSVNLYQYTLHYSI